MEADWVRVLLNMKKVSLHAVGYGVQSSKIRNANENLEKE